MLDVLRPSVQPHPDLLAAWRGLDALLLHLPRPPADAAQALPDLWRWWLYARPEHRGGWERDRQAILAVRGELSTSRSGRAVLVGDRAAPSAAEGLAGTADGLTRMVLTHSGPRELWEALQRLLPAEMAAGVPGDVSAGGIDWLHSAAALEAWLLERRGEPDAAGALAALAGSPAARLLSALDGDGRFVRAVGAIERDGRLLERLRAELDVELERVAVELAIEFDGAAARRPRASDLPPQGAAARPDRCRLAVDGERVLLDGERVVLAGTTDQRAEVLCYLAHLIDAAGEWRSSTEIDGAEAARPVSERRVLQGVSGVRWDRVRKRLPAAIMALVETDRRKGHRLCPAAWHSAWHR
jgi:hypothetical protein